MKQKKRHRAPRISGKGAADKTQLAPLTKYDPTKILPTVGQDPLASFILALALVFNDLKGLMLWRDAVLPTKPAGQFEVTPAWGQWVGLEQQSVRLVSAQLHELFELIKEFKSVLITDEFRNLLRKCPSSVRTQWQSIVSIALSEGTARNDFAQLLAEIRNWGAYHYNQPKRLVAGFRRCFLKNPPKPATEYALASVGDTMGMTRFFFADAAMEVAIEEASTKRMAHERFRKEMHSTVRAVNHSLSHLVQAYIKRAEVE
jgi:hypothetical protein